MLNKISTQLLTIITLGIVLLSAVLTTTSTVMIRSVFQDRYEERLQIPSRIFLSQYTYQDLLTYVEVLKSNPELESFEELKDEQYFDIYRNMLNLRLGTGVKYFYIVGDVGLEDRYLGLFDASFQGEHSPDQGGNLGTSYFKDAHPAAVRAFQSGNPEFLFHGTTYESYLPVLSGTGEVVALIITDINMQSLNSQLNSFLLISGGIIVFISILIVIILYFALRKLIVKPVQQLTEISGEIADGKLNTTIPDSIQRKEDEVGLLAKSYESMRISLKEMLSANKAKSEFLSRVSHELRTPLNAILSMAKLGLRDQSMEASKERLKKIVASSDHLSDIINDVLEMSRMESGKTEIRPAPMNLRQMIDDCIEVLNVKAEEKGIGLVSKVEEDVPNFLIGDEFRIKQILINLLSNAVKFTEEGQVVLTVGKQSKENIELTFVVEDSGIGMSEDFLTRIFQPFEQEDSFLSRRYEGSGLGMPISYNLAQLMHGDIRVTSTMGQGSRFEVTIPFELAEEKAFSHPEEESVAEVVSLEGKRVLLVDDIEINRMIISEIFAETGLGIGEAVDGVDAYEKFMVSPEGYYQCILMDIQMPRMNGYETARQIRGSGRSDSHVPIVAMTANALKEDIDEAVASGMDGHIAKPIDFNICIQTVQKYCLEK